MPIGIKDLFETRDMPAEMGSPIWKGNQSFRDAAHVHALREAGAVIVGKTVTTELGMSHPGPTTNPFDPARTPGGSSSGSAAAVGACMLPAAVGSQVVGSIIRPAGYCGNVAIKPTFGALNRGGGHSALSQSHLGVHAGSLEDAWAVIHAIHAGAGGDPGHPGLFGDQALAPAAKPGRLARIATAGWPDTDAATREAFGDVIEWLEDEDIEILGADDEPGHRRVRSRDRRCVQAHQRHLRVRAALAVERLRKPRGGHVERAHARPPRPGRCHHSGALS